MRSPVLEIWAKNRNATVCFQIALEVRNFYFKIFDRLYDFSAHAPLLDFSFYSLYSSLCSS